MDKLILGPGEFGIEEGYRAFVKGGDSVCVVKRKERSNRIKEGDFRCRDCKHRVKGRCRGNSVYETMVCEIRPKENAGGQKLFYCSPAFRFPCENFEYDPEKKKDYNSYRI